MLGRYLHGHDDRRAVGHVVAHVVHEEEGGLLHPATLPLAPLHVNRYRKKKTYLPIKLRNPEHVRNSEQEVVFNDAIRVRINLDWS